MRHAKNLARLSQLAQAQANHFGDTTADATIYFVKHHRWNGAAVTGDNLNGKTHTR
jgi:hypothetical protein